MPCHALGKASGIHALLRHLVLLGLALSKPRQILMAPQCVSTQRIILSPTYLSRVVPGAHVAEGGPDAVLNGGKVRHELEVGEAVEGGRRIAVTEADGLLA